jgi:hypothetical protein
MFEPWMLLVFQTVFLIPLLVSMAFRMKGNYFAHGITMIVAVAIELIGISSVSLLSTGVSMEPLMSPTSTTAVFGIHGFFGVATLISGIWLVALWRPHSTDFAVKSKRIWQSTVILWVATFLVGLLLYVALTTNFL